MNVADVAAAADAANAGSAASTAAVPPLPAPGASSSSFLPEGVIIHLTPMNTVRRSLVQVRLGNGPDCPVVRPPATLWFDRSGRLQAVASPSTESDAGDESINVDDDDDDEDDDDETTDVDQGSESGNNINSNGHGNGDIDVDDDDDEDDDVVFLGEFRNNSAQA